MSGGLGEEGGEVDLDFFDPVAHPELGVGGVGGEFGMGLNDEGEAVLEGDAAGADVLAAEDGRGEKPGAGEVGVIDLGIGVPVAEVGEGADVPFGGAFLDFDEVTASGGVEDAARIVGVPVGPVGAAGEAIVNVLVDVVGGVEGANADGDVAGVVVHVGGAIDFTAHIDGDHPGDGGGLVFEAGADGFGEVFEEEGIYGNAFAAASVADLGGFSFVEGVPGDGGRWRGVVAGSCRAFEVGPFKVTARSDEFGEIFQECEARWGRGMFDLREAGERDAFVAENLGEAADAIDLGVGKVNPVRLGGVRSDATETNSDKLACFL